MGIHVFSGFFFFFFFWGGGGGGLPLLHKGTSFCDFLCPLLDDVALLKWNIAELQIKRSNRNNLGIIFLNFP